MPQGKIISIKSFSNLDNSVRIKAQKFLKEKALYDWLEYLKRIESSGYGELVLKGFSKTSLDIIEKFGFMPIKIFYSTLSSVTIKKGQKTSYNFCNVCSEILGLYNSDKKFLTWLMLIEKMTNLAPEALEILLKEMSFLVEKMNVSQMEDWFLTCLRASSGDMEKRIKLLSLKDNEGLEWLGQSAGIKSFKEQENKLKI